MPQAPDPQKPAKPHPNTGRRASEPPPEVLALPEPGLIGRLPPEQHDALLTAVGWQRSQPPKPDGTPNVRDPETGRFEGGVPGRFTGPPQTPPLLREGWKANQIARTYLEEAIMTYHVRGAPDPEQDGKIRRRRLAELPELLGYSYRHIIATWAKIKQRAFDRSGETAQADEVRAFVRHHLEEAIRMASARMEDNAAYGAVVIRGCEALINLEGVEGSESNRLDLEELAEQVRGRSPLLLGAMDHAKGEAAKVVDAEIEDD